MSIRTIRNSAGATTGYQAFAGNGGPGLTAYVPATHRNVGAVLAEAVAHISGVRLLVLDRFDVLDLQGRADLIAWLDCLAETGEIDTALIFGTLKALPASLPPTFGAHWIENGVVAQLKEAA